MERENNLIRCPKCGTPLAEVQGNNVEFLKHQGGKTVRVKVRVQHDAGGRFDIDCDNCGAGGGFSFGRAQKTLPMKYEVKPAPPSEPPVDK